MEWLLYPLRNALREDNNDILSCDLDLKIYFAANICLPFPWSMPDFMSPADKISFPDATNVFILVLICAIFASQYDFPLCASE